VRECRIRRTREVLRLKQHGSRAALNRAFNEWAIVSAVDGIGEEYIARGKRARICVHMGTWLHASVQPGEGVGDLPVRWMLRT
jgi:hypothetical protein